MKAHQDLRELAEGSLALRRACGNEEADEAANRARLLHPAASPGAYAICELNFTDALVMSKLAGRALARWPTALPRVEVSAQHRAAQQTATAARRRRRIAARLERAQAQAECMDSHEWAHWGGIERCNVCLVSRARGGKQCCTGEPTQLWAKAAEAVNLGHQIWVGELVRIRGRDPSIPCLICKGCGGWAQTGQVKAAQGKLGRPCAIARLATSSGGFGRARRGLHPQAGCPYADIRLADLFPLPAEALRDWQQQHSTH